MRWVAAVKLWNSDHKNVNTANAYAIPRKETREYEQVKEISKTGKLPEKKIEEPIKKEIKKKEPKKESKKDDQMETTRIITLPGRTIVLKENTKKPIDDMEEKRIRIKYYNEIIGDKKKWENLSNNSKDAVASAMVNIIRSPRSSGVLDTPLKSLPKHIKEYIDKNKLDPGSI